MSATSRFLAIFLLSISAYAQIPNGSVTTYSTTQGNRYLQNAEADIRNYSGADVCAQINSAISSLPSTGGTVLVPAGNYSACAGSGGIAITMNKPGLVLKGIGFGSPMAGNTGATTINVAAGVTGIDVTGDRNSIENIFLVSASSGAGTDDGIRIRGPATVLHRVSAKHFGRTGIRIDAGVGNSDLWHFEDTEAVSNFGDGFRWVAPCSDNNLGTGIQLNSSFNGGWGYYVDCGGDNEFITTHATQNAAGGAFVNFPWQEFRNAYFESGVGSSFVIAPGLNGVNASFKAFGQPTTITNPGASNNANRIHYYGAGNWPVQNGLFLGGQPGDPQNKTYMLLVDGTSNGNFRLFDDTDGFNVFNFDPVLNTRFNFGQRVTMTATADRPGLNIGSVAGLPSTVVNGDMWYDTLLSKFRCQENGSSVNCIGSTGSVTHTVGPLTASQVVIGNGADDVKVDTGASTDGAGNVVAVSYTTSGVNGGFTGIEGDGSGLTPGSAIDLLYPDSTSHCWHSNLNNTDAGCGWRSLGAGAGSVFGTTAVNSVVQSTNTPWALTFQNAVATAGGFGGLGIYVENSGDSFISENTTGGVVTAGLGFRQSGEAYMVGNGAVGDPANVQFTIPNTATADFLFANGSSVTTGSPRIRLAGKTSGEGIISVAAVAGTPNPILLPTATGSSGQVLQTDGANPQQTSWVTDIKSYNHSGTAQTVTHIVRDRCTLGTDCSVTLSGSAVYTSSSTYDCVAIDRTGANAIQFAPSSGSAFALTGTGTDTISYVCVGN